jgi:hypothetical protein
VSLARHSSARRLRDSSLGRKPNSQWANAENRPENEPYRSGLLLTHPRPSAQDGPNDLVRDCRDGHAGRNLHGLALMRVRAELIADVRTRLGALTPTG